ncbi:hypothetical protein SEMRO_3543_G349090.1 [Seminavis robusta]|uniref:Uncharacterized protein n=1 Tax=Seminavis robusta TaxID=568900 RepID=A0A9N8HZE6_9STRA|nr:hypothetical protein SEMRO_3543_G349090.1 [Seminavis robusta]|eukprot:Sro3543_g349090.1 n/a (100) ;mRNA; f:3117-3416
MPESSMTQCKLRHRPNLHVESDSVADASGEIAQPWNKVTSTKKGKKKLKKKKKKATCPSTSNICAELFSPTNKESDSSSSSPTSSEDSNSKPSPTQGFA